MEEEIIDDNRRQPVFAILAALLVIFIIIVLVVIFSGGEEEATTLPANWSELGDTEKVALNPYKCEVAADINLTTGRCVEIDSTVTPVTLNCAGTQFDPADWEDVDTDGDIGCDDIAAAASLTSAVNAAPAAPDPKAAPNKTEVGVPVTLVELRDLLLNDSYTQEDKYYEYAGFMRRQGYEPFACSLEIPEDYHTAERLQSAIDFVAAPSELADFFKEYIEILSEEAYLPVVDKITASAALTAAEEVIRDDLTKEVYGLYIRNGIIVEMSQISGGFASKYCKYPVLPGFSLPD